MKGEILLPLVVFLAGACNNVDRAGIPHQAKDLNPVKYVKKAPTHSEVVLVKDGQALGQVVIMPSAEHHTFRQIIKELVEVIKESTGAELPVVHGKIPAGPALVIGDCEESQRAGIDLSKLPVEGYAIKTAPNRVFIAGRTRRSKPGARYDYDGNVHGVANFLERFVGVRWYWPTNLGGRSIRKSASLVVDPVWYEDAPVYRMRTVWPPFDAVPAKTDYRHMYRLLGAGNSWETTIQCHTPHWGGNQDYVKNKPELFMLRADNTRNFGMICYGNPETLKVYLAEIAAIKSGRPIDRKFRHNMVHVTKYSITVSPADLGVTCKCKDCTKLMEKGKGRWGSASNLLGAFVADLGREVKKRWPDMTVTYLPYVNYTLAPDGIEFPDNVEVELCGMPGLAMYKEPAIRKQFQGNIDKWRQLTGRKAHTWEYSCWPADRTKAAYQYPHVLKAYYQHNRDKLVGSFINGGNGDWVRQHVTLYCWLKLYWNPDYDVDAMMDEYARRMYGPAAKSVRKLLSLQCDRWEKVRWKNPQLNIQAVYQQSFTKKIVAKMKALIKQAYQKAGNDAELKKRLDYYTHPFAKFFEEAKAVHDGGGLRTLISKKVGDNPIIDGKLDDDCWQVAEPVAFHPNGEKHPARYPTEVRSVWTLDGISFGFRMSEPHPNELVCSIRSRDDAMAWHQDNIELFLDVSGKNEGKFYQFIINPNPTVYDSRNGNVDWNAKGMKVATHIGKDHWSLELYFPNSEFPEMIRPATNAAWVGQFTRHRISDGQTKRTEDNHPEYTRMNHKFGGPSANTGDFGVIKFVE